MARSCGEVALVRRRIPGLVHRLGTAFCKLPPHVRLTPMPQFEKHTRCGRTIVRTYQMPKFGRWVE